MIYSINCYFCKKLQKQTEKHEGSNHQIQCREYLFGRLCAAPLGSGTHCYSRQRNYPKCRQGYFPGRRRSENHHGISLFQWARPVDRRFTATCTGHLSGYAASADSSMWEMLLLQYVLSARFLTGNLNASKGEMYEKVCCKKY